MKYLCLAYGAEKDWRALSKSEQDTLLAQDAIIRSRGALMAAVDTEVTTVRAWDGEPTLTNGAFGDFNLPLAGFSVIEAGRCERGHPIRCRDAVRPCERSDRNTADHEHQ
jgi:hypothetical protein